MHKRIVHSNGMLLLVACIYCSNKTYDNEANCHDEMLLTLRTRWLLPNDNDTVECRREDPLQTCTYPFNIAFDMFDA